jgi:two-component system, OmpR family, sensor kinase
VRAERPGLRVELEREGRTLGWFDRERLCQAVRHLLLYAAARSASGSPLRLGSRAGPERVELWLRFTGSDLSPDELSAAFEPTQPADGEDIIRLSAGLDLYLARRIAEAHGGHAELTLAGEEVLIVLHLPWLQPNARARGWLMEQAAQQAPGLSP